MAGGALRLAEGRHVDTKFHSSQTESPRLLDRLRGLDQARAAFVALGRGGSQAGRRSMPTRRVSEGPSLQGEVGEGIGNNAAHEMIEEWV